MRALMPFLASFMLVLIAWTSIAHGAENALCVDMPQAALAAQMDTDCTQMQSDTGRQSNADKGCPRHGAACHVHHFAAPADVGVAIASDIAPITFLRYQPRIDLTRRGYPAMRPPRA